MPQRGIRHAKGHSPTTGCPGSWLARIDCSWINEEKASQIGRCDAYLGRRGLSCCWVPKPGRFGSGRGVATEKEERGRKGIRRAAKHKFIQMNLEKPRHQTFVAQIIRVLMEELSSTSREWQERQEWWACGAFSDHHLEP